MTDENLPAVATQAPPPAPLLAFSSIENFEKAQRMAKLLAASDLVPVMYKGEKGVANCLIAMEVAAKTGNTILAVVQNLNIIHGRPSWSATYTIAALNSCGRFSPLSLPVDGEGDERGCQASASVLLTGEVVEGPRVTIKMAKAEKWYSRKDKNGRETSKWPNMPDLMLRYRAAAFFGRLYAPEVLMGMRTEDESQDIAPPTVVNPNEVREVPVEVQPEEKPKNPRRKRRSKEEIAADKAAKESPENTEAGQDDPPPPIQAPAAEPSNEPEPVEHQPQAANSADGDLF